MLCNGLRGHKRLLHLLSEEFQVEYKEAKRERERLEKLFLNVSWFNFEVGCRTWRHPWPETWVNSFIELTGVRIDKVMRNGREREVGTFPTYYAGPIRDAPPLPPYIIWVEWKNAVAYEKVCLQHVTAPYDWAPGGYLYNELQQTTLVPTISKRLKNGQTHPCDEAPEDVLGGVY